jgi:hypothetical protein
LGLYLEKVYPAGGMLHSVKKTNPRWPCGAFSVDGLHMKKLNLKGTQ